MSFEKENFLRTKLIGYLQRLDPSTPPHWGKMSVQHMIEHLADIGFSVASGRHKFDTIATAPDKLQRIRDFLMSDKAFKPGTINPLLPVDPAPLQYKTVQAAIGALHEELIYFFATFEQDPQLVTRNPIFGDLDFVQNVQLLHKHSLHHLRQFGVEPLDA